MIFWFQGLSEGKSCCPSKAGTIRAFQFALDCSRRAERRMTSNPSSESEPNPTDGTGGAAAGNAAKDVP